MQEIEFYDQILGFKSLWFFAAVTVDPKAPQFDVFNKHPPLY